MWGSVIVDQPHARGRFTPIYPKKGANKALFFIVSSKKEYYLAYHTVLLQFQ